MILFKITHLFRSRNFNIDSISVGITDNPDYSRMTITTNSDEKRVAQIVKQLEKMIDTVEVKQLDEHKTVYLVYSNHSSIIECSLPLSNHS